MRNNDESGRLSRRGVLECMTWAGTAMVWTMVGGVPRARLIGSASAATTDFSFVQVSDSHLGFDNPVHPDRGHDTEVHFAHASREQMMN